MNPRRVLTVLLAVCPLCLLSPLRAGDRLPDEAAVKAFAASADCTLNGWWRVVDPPSRPTPGWFLFLDSPTGPRPALRMKLVQGSIHSGKGALAESEFSAEFSETGEITSAALHVAFGALTTRVSLTAAPDGKWSVDVFGEGKTNTLTAANFEEALTLVSKHAGPAGEILTDFVAKMETLQKPAAAPEKVTLVKVEHEGGKQGAWQVEMPGKCTFMLSRTDGRVLQYTTPKFAMQRSTEAGMEALRQAMKKKNDPPRNPALIEGARLTFYDVDRKWFSPSRTRRVEPRPGNVVEVVTGLDGKVPAGERTEDLAPYAKPDPAVTGHAKFQELLAAEADAIDDESVAVEVAIRFALCVRRTIPRDFDHRAASLADCLDKGKGDIVALTRLVVQACRQREIPCREAHGFVVEADSLPVVTRRHCWMEVLQEGQWHALDPWLPGEFDEDGAWTQPWITGLHVEVCHGVPSAEQEKFLDSDPAVTVMFTDKQEERWGRPVIGKPRAVYRSSSPGAEEGLLPQE